MEKSVVAGKTLSIIIPVYNEYNTLEKIIEKVRLADTAGLRKEIILVDDGSTDGTRQLYPGLKEKVGKIILHEHNQGKGAALRTGIAAAEGDFVLIQDADLEYDPNDYCTLLQPLLSGEAEVVYGSRFMEKKSQKKEPFWHLAVNRTLTGLSNLFTGLKLSDMETCYKVFRRDVLQKIKLCQNRFGFEAEVTAKVARLKYKIVEVPIFYHGRTYEEGKKIGWKDGLNALWCIFRYWLKS